MTPGGNHQRAQADIERIVRQVLAELTSGSKASAILPAEQALRTGDELAVDRKVVSLADVEGRLKGVTRVVAPRGAVFTPAARDELRKYGVTVASAVTAKSAAPVRRVLLGVAESAYEPASLAAALTAEGIGVERLPKVGLTSVVDELSEQIFKSGERGLLITTHTAVAVCLANRHHGVRAVLGGSARATADAVAAVGANLVVVDANGKSLFELRSMTRHLVQGAGICPPAWKDRLG